MLRRFLLVAAACPRPTSAFVPAPHAARRTMSGLVNDGTGAAAALAAADVAMKAAAASDEPPAPSSADASLASAAAALEKAGAPDSIADPDWLLRLRKASGKSRKTRGGNYVQLATADAGGHPRVRTVVFRGWEADPLGGRVPLMRFVTDARSSKLAESRAAEVCWWFQKTSEQFRLAGTLLYVGGGAEAAATGDALQPLERAALARARVEAWKAMRDEAREDFFGPTPGLNRLATLVKDEAEPPPPVPAGGRNNGAEILPPPDAFVLVLLRVSRADHLVLGHPQQRFLDVLREGTPGEWESERVNP